MERYTKLEITVGAFAIVGALALGYVSISLGGLSLFDEDHYQVSASFASISGLKLGAPVKIAGVNVGEVEQLKLKNYAAEVTMSVQSDIRLSEDTIASIQSSGLLGDAHISLSPGGSDKDLGDGGHILRTEPAISLTELISKYAFGSPISDESSGQSGSRPNSGGSGGGMTKPDDTQNEDKKSPFSDPLE